MEVKTVLLRTEGIDFECQIAELKEKIKEKAFSIKQMVNDL